MFQKIRLYFFVLIFSLGISADTFSKNQPPGASRDLQGGGGHQLNRKDQVQTRREDRARHRLGDKAEAAGLITAEERQQYRDRMKSAQTQEEREEIRQQHREEIRARAREKGLEDNF